MVYSAALLFGHTAAGLWEDGVVDMIGRYLFQRGPGSSSARRGGSPPGPGSSSARRGGSPPGPGSSSARRGSVDSCDEPDRSSPYSGQGLEVQLLQQAVTQQMELRLTEAKASVLQCQVLLLPRHMTTRVGHDVVRTSADEPCGLRGASIKIYVEGKDGLKAAGSILPDPTVTPTFELSVVFKADQEGGWPPLKHIFDASKVLKLRPEYRLVKRKLYSSASPVIHYSSE